MTFLLFTLLFYIHYIITISSVMAIIWGPTCNTLTVHQWSLAGMLRTSVLLDHLSVGFIVTCTVTEVLMSLYALAHQSTFSIEIPIEKS